MKMASIATGFVCVASTVAAAGQNGTPGGDGPIGQYDVELIGSNGYFINVGNVPVSQMADFSRQATVAVPRFWEDRSFDGLEAGQNEARSEFESFIESDATSLSGRMDISAWATSEFDSGGSSTRLFHELAITVPDLDTVADVHIRLSGNANVSGFGRSMLSFAFESDEFSEQGMIREDLNDGVSVLFEAVRVTQLDIAFTAITEAGTDSPVNSARADLTANWSVDIVPIPAPGSAMGFMGLGLLAARRRR